ncbi:unnamed protein product [Heterobilharzia americana]|nr:unnamed protein product [Heterobilharzia americana]CAH8636390.1 unnamed protein product [Heterobilharzia americana]
MFLCVYSQISSSWNVKQMSYMSLLLILLIKSVIIQSGSLMISANETTNNLNVQDEQQRAQALAKLMSLFYTSDAFNKYMENLDAYYMLRGRPRFGKRSSYPFEDTDGPTKSYRPNTYRHQQLRKKYLSQNADNDYDEGLVKK